MKLEDPVTTRQRIKDMTKETNLASYESELDGIKGMTVIRAANVRKSKSLRDQLLAIRDELDGIIAKEAP